ncbi:MAG: GSCFA domain-containing protein [Prevotellaceae bacterium]|jgi:hypothetical protein|nr:GSCFA domain-containing protein [Prevotellaceae bacterium]
MSAKFKLQTEVKIDKTAIISHESRFLLLGSCFAVNIGNRLLDNRFSGDVNPFGILFNPLSIANSLQRLLWGREFAEEEVFEHDGLWHSIFHHGEFSSPSIKKTLEKINARFTVASTNLKETDVLIITFGSSWVYLYNGQIVANCHKLPENKFERKRLTISEIVLVYKNLFETLFKQNPNLNIILSVSPVRYFRDGAFDNSTNKATLLLAVEELVKIFEQVHYFPAYEIVLDELRDYRFYAEDMLHPSDFAQKIIWQRFADACFTDETKALLPQIEKQNKMLAHRPFLTDN